MSATTYLFIANGAVWLGVAGYLVFLATRSAELERRVCQLELLGGDNHDG
jgi:CcmD family protein